MIDFVIGGEFGISPDMFLLPEINNPEEYYNKKHYIYVDTGRSALYLALCSIIKQGGKKEAWIPYYSCYSVLIPFKHLGFKLNYYSMGDDLQSPSLLPQYLNGITFLFINYFGSENRAITRWLDKMNTDDYGFIIEDNVQASLNSNLGKHGHFVVNSYRKFLPQPDGALLSSDFPIEYDLSPPDEAFVSQKAIGKMLRANQGKPDIFLNLFSDSEYKLDIEPRSMSYLSKYMFARTNLREIKELRRSNWNYLYELFKSEQLLQRKIYPLYSSLKSGEVPLGFPIKINSAYRNKLRAYLMSQSVFCPVHWNLPHQIPNQNLQDFADDIKLSRSILTLPIDQRLDRDALKYLYTKILYFFRKNGI